MAFASGDVKNTPHTQYPVAWFAATAVCCVVAIALASLGGSRLFGTALNSTRISFIVGGAAFTVAFLGTGVVAILRKKEYEKREQAFVRFLLSCGEPLSFDGSEYVKNYPLPNLRGIIQSAPASIVTVWLLCDHDLDKGLSKAKFIELLAGFKKENVLMELFRYWGEQQIGKDLISEFCEAFYDDKNLSHTQKSNLAVHIASVLYQINSPHHKEFLGSFVLHNEYLNNLGFFKSLHTQNPDQLPNILVNFKYEITSTLTGHSPTLLHLCLDDPETVGYLVSIKPHLVTVEMNVTKSNGDSFAELPIQSYERVLNKTDGIRDLLKPGNRS